MALMTVKKHFLNITIRDYFMLVICGYYTSVILLTMSDVNFHITSTV